MADTVNWQLVELRRTFFQLAVATVELELGLIGDAAVVKAAPVWGSDNQEAPEENLQKWLVA